MPQTKRTAGGVLGGLIGLLGLSVVAAVLVTATITPAIAISGAAANGALTMFDKLPGHLDIEKLMLPSTIYAKNTDTDEWEPMAQFYDQNRSPVTFDEIAPIVYDAVLSSEDKNFYKHGGVDLLGTVGALYDNLRGGDPRGGSSISQQYVKNVLVQKCEMNAPTQEELDACYAQATTARGAEGIQRKVQEMRYAIALEDKYSKNEILLGYLNIAGFGGTTYGIDAAAQRYFGVSAADLSIAQAATLAGMVQEPNRFRIDQPGGTWVDRDGVWHNSEADGYEDTKKRRDYVLWRLHEDGKISDEQYEAALAEPITPAVTQPKIGCSAAVNAEYFCQHVKSVILSDPAFGEELADRVKLLQRGGLEIYTTLDWRLQNEANGLMRESTPTAVDGIKFGAAAVNLGTDGRILSMVQNTVFNESETASAANGESSLVYAADFDQGGSIGFEAGSTFKLFTLIDWLEQGRSVNEVLNGRLAGTAGSYHNSCTGESWTITRDKPINNFNMAPGRAASIMSFTADSLNSGFLAMAKQLDLCSIGKVATKMGVDRANGSPIDMADGPYQVLGSDNVSPLAMAGAYATVANGGMYCEPHAIDRVIDADGVDRTPAYGCERVLEPAVAATAAYALRGVMYGGGSGAPANPYDGVPLIGKTGTHETWQTWLVETSTNVTTAVWVGTTEEQGNITRQWYNGRQLNYVRHHIGYNMQRVANMFYGGNEFPAPDGNLTRRILTDLPNVIGRSIDEARSILEDAGFDVNVGDAVDSSEAEGIIVAQDPGAGRVAGGTTVTISPSNGRGVTVPDVSGRSFQDAERLLRAAGFGNIQRGTCTEDEDAGNRPTATSTSPAAGEVANRNAAISINYTSERCP